MPYLLHLIRMGRRLYLPTRNPTPGRSVTDLGKKPFPSSLKPDVQVEEVRVDGKGPVRRCSSSNHVRVRLGFRGAIHGGSAVGVLLSRHIHEPLASQGTFHTTQLHVTPGLFCDFCCDLLFPVR